MKIPLLEYCLFTALLTACTPASPLIHPQSELCLAPVTKNKPAGYRPTAWSIGIFRGNSPLTLNDDPTFGNPVVTPRDVTDRTARFVADPFLIRRDAKWFLFFEVMNCGTEQGDIGFAESSDLKSWHYGRIVLDEDFHLSYPHVFKHAGHVYMIPESRQAQQVRLYRAVNFPIRWTLDSVLIRGNYADPSIIFYQNRWWVFAVEGGYSLSIFYSDTLRGPWTKHPGSPFYPDNKSKTRPGGRMVIYDGKLTRFAQENSERYGHMVRAFEIDTLTPSTFIEHEVSAAPVLKPNGKGWREVGMHQVDPQEIGPGEWVGAVDGTGY